MEIIKKAFNKKLFLWVLLISIFIICLSYCAFKKRDEPTQQYNNPKYANSLIMVALSGSEAYADNIEGSSAYFDHNNDGFKEESAWMGSNTGFLVLDRNNDGQVNGRAELFGEDTVLSNGKKAINGFEALKELDTNHDGKIDEQDPAYKELKVWKDNVYWKDNAGYCVVNEGELKTLADWGIRSISVDYVSRVYMDYYDNEHRAQSKVIFMNGKVSTAIDIRLRVNLANRKEDGSLKISKDVAAMPNAKGFGKVHDLHQAMMLDPKLKVMLNQYIVETNSIQKDWRLDLFIYRWTGSASVAPNSRDNIYCGTRSRFMDARQLVTLENLTYNDFLGFGCDGKKSPNPNPKAVDLLTAEYTQFKQYTKAQILIQTVYADTLGKAFLSEFKSGIIGFDVDWKKINNLFDSLQDNGDYEKIVELYAVLKDLGLYSPSYRSNLQSKVDILVNVNSLRIILERQLYTTTIKAIDMMHSKAWRSLTLLQ